jgi:hypothetical protein
MKKICIILFAGLLVSAGLQAQEVYIEDGKVILDMTVETGMPAGAITAIPKTWTGNPSNNGDPLSNNTHSGTINEKVFQKLEIAPSDLGTMTWTAAMTGCKNEGEGWRLPTQRELMMMWIFNDALNDVLEAVEVGGNALSANPYRSATEIDASYVWSVSFGIGATTNQLKATPYRVRCVREVTTP